jgi:hypothetical protein
MEMAIIRPARDPHFAEGGVNLPVAPAANRLIGHSRAKADYSRRTSRTRPDEIPAQDTFA